MHENGTSALHEFMQRETFYRSSVIRSISYELRVVK